MKNTLAVTFHLTAHPYPEDVRSQFEVWGQINMHIYHANHARRVSLLSIQWDIAPFAEWFANNWHSICKKTLASESDNFLVLPSESIAEAMQRLQEREFPESEEEIQFKWFSSLFEFRTQHSLRFALRGTDIPEIFVGYNHSQGEVSLANGTEGWSYSFDMINFCNQTKKELQNVLEQWIENSLSSAAIESIRTLITRLEMEIDCASC